MHDDHCRMKLRCHTNNLNWEEENGQKYARADKRPSKPETSKKEHVGYSQEGVASQHKPEGEEDETPAQIAGKMSRAQQAIFKDVVLLRKV